MSHSSKNKLQPFEGFGHLLDQHTVPYSTDYIADYPDVPDPHQTTWATSDQYTRHDYEWQQALVSTKSALLAAIDECDALASATAPSTPSGLTLTLNRLRRAIHKSEDAIEALSEMYPLPLARTPSALAKQKDPTIPAPMLLYHSDDQILFWLPALPNKSRRANSHLYTDFRALLQVHQFAPFGAWHCDFIHVFSASNQGAILGARDVDNYPYKPFIDALVLALRSPDEAFNFSCGMYNLLSNRIKSGCYISITKRSKKVGFFQAFEDQVFALE